MSYRQEIDALTRGLATVVTSRKQLVGMDLEAGIAGFTATAQLLRQVHVDLVGTGPHAPRDLAALDRDPVCVLGRLLHDIPALPQAAMTDIQSATALTETGGHWRVVARSATLAHHDWTTALRASHPTGPAARAELAVHARIAEVLAVTGPGLARYLRTAGRSTDAARLLTATTSGLRIAAAAARHATHAGAATQLADVTQAAPSLVLVVRRPSHLPAALDRLATLIDGARHLTPQHVQLIARAGAETATAAATVLRLHGHRRPADTLDRHAGLLAAVAGTGRRTASITPPDPRPLAQADQIHQTVRGLGRSAGFHPDDAWHAGQALSSVTRALDRAAGREIGRRTWLVPSDAIDPTRLAWVPVDVKGPLPRLAGRLAAAVEHADQVSLGLTLVTGRPLPPSRLAPRQAVTATTSATHVQNVGRPNQIRRP
jgi:hypothetical protein